MRMLSDVDLQNHVTVIVFTSCKGLSGKWRSHFTPESVPTQGQLNFSQAAANNRVPSFKGRSPFLSPVSAQWGNYLHSQLSVCLLGTVQGNREQQEGPDLLGWKQMWHCKWVRAQCGGSCEARFCRTQTTRTHHLGWGGVKPYSADSRASLSAPWIRCSGAAPGNLCVNQPGKASAGWRWMHPHIEMNDYSCCVYSRRGLPTLRTE